MAGSQRDTDQAKNQSGQHFDLVAGLVVTAGQRAAMERALTRGRLPEVAVALTRVVFSSSDRERARQGAAYMRQAIYRASARALRSLEREYRSPRFFTAFGSDATVSASSFASWRDVGEPALGALAIASVQRAGIVREQAVIELAAISAAPACGLLLVRLNDPVWAIARRARAGLERWLVASHVSTLARYLPLVDGMDTWARTARHLDSIAERIYALVAAHPQVLRAHTKGGDADVRLSCYRLLLRTCRRDEDMAELLRRALSDRSPRVRHHATEVILDPSQTPASVRPSLLTAMASDRSPRTRAKALRWLFKQPDAEAHVRRAVFDRNANVRFLARRYAHRLGLDIPYRRLALAVLGGDAGSHGQARRRDQLVAALATLSDHGLQADCPAVRPYRQHPIAAVRKEAVRTANILECPDQAC